MYMKQLKHNMMVYLPQPRNHGKHDNNYGIDTSELMVVIIIYPVDHLNLNRSVEHIWPPILQRKKMIDRTSYIINTLSTEYTQQAFFRRLCSTAREQFWGGGY